jgi:hypothetical protein
MATEIYSNLDPKKASHLDKRLKFVADVASLPDLTIAENFLYEGATVYVREETNDYQAQFTVASPAQLVWVSLAPQALLEGAISISSSVGNLDLSLVQPPIATCKSVTITVVGGTKSTIKSISNWPEGQRITFYSSIGNIITYAHTDYDQASIGSITSEDGQDIYIEGRTTGNDSVTFELNKWVNTNGINYGVSLVQWNATQFIKTSELQQNLLNLVIEDSLTSNSTSTALSANQGFVLNNLISAKQDIISAGDHISIGGGGNILKALPWDWLKEDLTGINLTGGIEAYLISNWGAATTSNYRYVKQDEIQYILPPLLSPAVLTNWIQIGYTPTSTKVTRYDLFHEIPFDNLDAGSGNYYLKLDTISPVGDFISPEFGGPIGGPNKFSFAVSGTGLFKIEYKIHLLAPNAVLTLYRTDGVTVSGDPLSVSPVELETAYPGRTISLSTLQEINIANQGNGFVVEMTPDPLGGGWLADTGLFSANPGWVEITKIR